MLTFAKKMIMIIGIVNTIILIYISIPELPKTKPIKYTIKQTENYVLLGDSIIDWYPIEENYEGYPIVNSGRAGYKTWDIINELEQLVYIFNPTKVLILIGTNDLNRDDYSQERTLTNIKEIAENIQANRPKTKIYIQSIYPINNTDDKKIIKSTVGIRTNEDIKNINKSLEYYCKEKGITYINMYDELIDNDGNLKLDYTKDGLHLNDEGYSVVTKVLKAYMNEETA